MRQSQLLSKTLKDISKDEVSLNAQLLLRAGFVDKLMAGVFSYLPLGLRVLTKIENIIREEMNLIGAQEILMPALHPRENWDITERWDVVDVLFKLKGAGEKDLALGATHEEIVTPLVQKFVFSYKDLPQAVYQIQTKFRNEPRAKSGLLRGREFRMKDLYSFHTSQEELDDYYKKVTEAYHKIYKRLGIGERTFLTYASGGAFSKYSHEFQTVTEAGEDLIYFCNECNVAINKEILEDLENKCPECGKNSLEEKKAIEVGNIFKLGTRFSDSFQFEVTTKEGNSQKIIMGCYGIGPSRIMGTLAEIHNDEKGIIWPKSVAPYQVHLISLCRTDEHKVEVENIYSQLIEKGIEVLFDDREGVTAGAKFADSDLMGIPQRVVVSPRTLENSSVEVKNRNEAESKIIPLDELFTVLS
jgi:prolyl-tRNA synthetase